MHEGLNVFCFVEVGRVSYFSVAWMGNFSLGKTGTWMIEKTNGMKVIVFSFFKL